MSEKENIYSNLKLHIDDNKYIDCEAFDNLFEQIKETLKDSSNNIHTGVMNSYLAGYVAQKTAEIFDIMNNKNNGKIKYTVSRLELKKNND